MFPPSMSWRSYHHAKARWTSSRPLAAPCGSLRVRRLGYVLLPLFLETQENETLEEALNEPTLKKHGMCFRRCRSSDAVLADIIREMREERGRKGGFDDSRLRERVEVLGPEVSLDVLRDAVSTALVDRLGITWDERYGEVKKYKERFGDCNVPVSWPPNPMLGTWVATQRRSRGQRQLSAERRIQLDALGFDWDPIGALWEEGFRRLQEFAKEQGHCRVPQRYVTAGVDID